MFSHDNGGLHNHFDHFFSEIASVHKYQTRLACWQKYHLPRMTASLRQLSLKYVGPKIWFNIPENLKTLSPFINFENNIKTHCYLAKIPVHFSSYPCPFSVISFYCPYFPSYILPLQLLTPLYTGMLFSHCFLLLCCFRILSDVNSMHFVTFLLLLVKRVQLKINLCC